MLTKEEQEDSFDFNDDIQLSDLKNIHYDFNDDQSLFTEQIEKQNPIDLNHQEKKEIQLIKNSMPIQSEKTIQTRQNSVKCLKQEQQRSMKPISNSKKVNDVSLTAQVNNIVISNESRRNSMHKRSSSSSNIIQRSQTWIHEKRNKILQKQRQKHQQQTKQCSFKPRLNSHLKQSHEYNNISNINSFSIKPKALRENKENIVPIINKIEKQIHHKPLIQKWQDQILEQQSKMKEKLDKRCKNQRNLNILKRQTYFPSRSIITDCQTSILPTSSSPEQYLKQYYQLIMKADKLFNQLKTIKVDNQKIMKQLKYGYS